jgi:hypothetical protein
LEAKDEKKKRGNFTIMVINIKRFNKKKWFFSLYDILCLNVNIFLSPIIDSQKRKKKRKRALVTVKKKRKSPASNRLADLLPSKIINIIGRTPTSNHM